MADTRSTEGASGGNALYVFIIDPVVPGTDYSIHGAIARVFPKKEREKLGREVAECFAAGYNILNLSDTSLTSPTGNHHRHFKGVLWP